TERRTDRRDRARDRALVHLSDRRGRRRCTDGCVPRRSRQQRPRLRSRTVALLAPPELLLRVSALDRVSAARTRARRRVVELDRALRAVGHGVPADETVRRSFARGGDDEAQAWL